MVSDSARAAWAPEPQMFPQTEGNLAVLVTQGVPMLRERHASHRDCAPGRPFSLGENGPSPKGLASLRRAAGADQFNHLASEFRCVGWSRLRHRGLSNPNVRVSTKPGQLHSPRMRSNSSSSRQLIVSTRFPVEPPNVVLAARGAGLCFNEPADRAHEVRGIARPQIA